LSRDLTDLKAQIIAAVKNTDAPMLMHVSQELEHHIDVCHVKAVHTVQRAKYVKDPPTDKIIRAWYKQLQQ
jgi:hypothetical protein